MSLLGLNDNRPPMAKAFLCYCFNLFLLILSCRSINFLAIDNIHAIFFLAPLFYWIVNKPQIMPLWFIFLGGLAIDFAVDGLLGLHAFLFILLTLTLYRVRRVILSQPFIYTYVIFIIATFIFEIVRYALISALTWQMPIIWPFLLAVVVNIVAYAPIVLVLKSLHRVMSGYGRSL